MCAVTSIVDRSVRSIESIDGRYGGCWRRSSPKPPSHKPRRRLNSSSTPGPVDCARAVWRETLSWVPFGAAPPQVTRLSTPDNPLQTAPFLIARYDDARAKPTHARALRRRRRSLARSRARCVAVTVEVAGGYIARHARYARRASRACTRTSSPRIARVIAVSVPPVHDRHARAAAAAALARSLDARAAVAVVVMGVAVGHAARHTHHALRITRAHVRVITARSRASSPFPSPRAHARLRCSGGGARSLDSARGVWRAAHVAGGVGGARYTAQSRASRAPRITRAQTHHRASRTSHRFVAPRARPTRARCGGGGARSLARSRARTCGGGCDGGGDRGL